MIDQLETFVQNKYHNDRKFRNEMENLKRLRVKADYFDTPIDSSKSYISIKLFNSVQQILKKNVYERCNLDHNNCIHGLNPRHKKNNYFCF